MPNGYPSDTPSDHQARAIRTQPSDYWPLAPPILPSLGLHPRHCGLRPNPLHRPRRVLGDQRLRVAGRLSQRGQSPFVADVPQGHTDIAQQAAPLGAQHRRAGEAVLEPGLVQRRAAPASPAVPGPGARAPSSFALRARTGSRDKPARQSSQPKMRLPIAGRSSTGMEPFNSMVR